MLKKELFQVIEAFHTMLFDPLDRNDKYSETICICEGKRK
jgi:hypothetical protein